MHGIYEIVNETELENVRNKMNNNKSICNWQTMAEYVVAQSMAERGNMDDSAMKAVASRIKSGTNLGDLT